MAYFAYWRASKRATIVHRNQNSLIMQYQVNPSHHLWWNSRKWLISHIGGRQNAQKNMFQKFFWAQILRKGRKCRKKSAYEIWKHLKHINIAKMAKNHDFSNVVANCGATRIFTENPAVSLFIIYHWLTSCQKSKKSLERLSGKSV